MWPEPIDSVDRFLRYKTKHRPVYDRAPRKVKELGFIDAIFHNERGPVTEGTDHSVFVRHKVSWSTPTISAGVSLESIATTVSRLCRQCVRQISRSTIS